MCIYYQAICVCTRICMWDQGFSAFMCVWAVIGYSVYVYVCEYVGSGTLYLCMFVYMYVVGFEGDLKRGSGNLCV